MNQGNYSKNATIDRFIATAHRRAVVFYKLCRHKVNNGNLPGNYTDYLTPLAHYLKETISRLNSLKNTDLRQEKKRDEKGFFVKTSTSSKRWEDRIFSRREFDDECRKIIAEKSSSITQTLQIK